MAEPSDPSESKRLDRSGDSQADDARLLRLLLAVFGDSVEDFADALPPPTGIRSFIRRADRRQLRGLLIETVATLYRTRPK